MGVSGLCVKEYNILSLDTSTDACSAALLFKGEISEEFVLSPKMHTQILLPMVDKLLKAHNLSFDAIDVFAFGRGPGSFTGVRIACSVIQAFSAATNKPIIAVSTLQALAQAAFDERGLTKVCAYLDARMQEYYWGLYQYHNESNLMQPIEDEKLQPYESMNLQKPKDFEAISGYPHAKYIAKIAAFEFEQGHAVSASDALPVYLRDDVVKKG